MRRDDCWPGRLSDIPSTRRWIEPRLKEGKILVLTVENLSAYCHKSSRQFIGCPVQISQLKFALSQPQMKERIPNSLGTMHSHREIIPARRKVPTKEIRIPDSGQNPSCSFPIGLGFWQQVPRSISGERRSTEFSLLTHHLLRMPPECAGGLSR